MPAVGVVMHRVAGEARAWWSACVARAVPADARGRSLDRAASTWLVCGLIGLGVAVRIAEYAANRSLWRDEAALALAIVARTFGRLLEPLDDATGPLAYLALERASFELFGGSEYALRLVALAASLAALGLFAGLITHCVDRAARPIALALFTLAPTLVYHAAEVKPYSVDVVVAVALAAIGVRLLERGASGARAIALGAVGAAAIWFSYAAVFVLVGVAAGVALESLRRRDGQGLRRLALAGVAWAASLALYYTVFLRHVLGRYHDELRDYWRDAFLPVASPLASAKWLVGSFTMLTDARVSGFEFPGLAGFALLVGAVATWRARPAVLALLATPVVAVIAASAFGAYPFYGRVILFLAPAVFVLVAQGVVTIGGTRPWIASVLAGLLLLHPAYEAAVRVVRSPAREELRPVLAAVRARWREGDRVYVYAAARPAFAYYAPRFGFRDADSVLASEAGDRWSVYRREVAGLRTGTRVWLLFSHVLGVDDKVVLDAASCLGRQRDVITARGAAAYLYDTSERPTDTACAQ